MADSNLKFRQTTSGAHGSAGRADCLPRRKPPARIGVRQLCRKKIRCWGLGTPTTAGASRQLQCPKVPKVRAESPLVRPQAHPPCRGIDAPTTAREWDLPSHGALTLFFRWRKKSVQKKASGTATPEAAHVAMRRGLRSAVAERLDAPNLFGASNSGP